MDLSYKNIWTITAPILFSMLLQQIIGITDVIFLGKIGEIALSGSALGSTYYIIIFMVAVGFTLGAQIIMARRNGEQNYEKIGPVFFQATTTLSVSSFAVIALSYFLAPYLLQAIISSPEVYKSTLDYINWRILGFIPLFIMIMIRTFYVSITKTKILTYTYMLMVSANVLLNYILIFGNFGAPRLGIIGAAMASALAELIALLFLLFAVITKVDLKKYGLTKFVYRDWQLLKEICRLSGWTMLQQFISLSAWFVFFIAIEHLGSTELAASNILRSLSAFPFIALNSLAITAGTLISNLIGANQENKVLFCCNRIIGLSFAIIIPLLILMSVFKNELLALYTPDQNLINEASIAYFVMLGVNILYVPSFVLFNAITGSGHPKKAMIIELFGNIAYIAHVIFVILYLKANLAWAFTADYACYLIILIMSANFMYSNKWQNAKV